MPAGFAVQMPDPKAYGARISRRASTPDRNPVCGKIAANLYVLGARLGARGLTLAPLLGDMMAAQMLDMPVTLGLDIRGGYGPISLSPSGTKFNKKAVLHHLDYEMLELICDARLRGLACPER